MCTECFPCRITVAYLHENLPVLCELLSVFFAGKGVQSILELTWFLLILIPGWITAHTSLFWTQLLWHDCHNRPVMVLIPLTMSLLFCCDMWVVGDELTTNCSQSSLQVNRSLDIWEMERERESTLLGRQADRQICTQKKEQRRPGSESSSVYI